MVFLGAVQNVFPLVSSDCHGSVRGLYHLICSVEAAVNDKYFFKLFPSEKQLGVK